MKIYNHDAETRNIMQLIHVYAILMEENFSEFMRLSERITNIDRVF